MMNDEEKDEYISQLREVTTLMLSLTRIYLKSMLKLGEKIEEPLGNTNTTLSCAKSIDKD